MSTSASATIPSTTSTPAADKPKGSKPSHRIFRSTKSNDGKNVQEIGAMWPHKDGQGFSIKLKATINPGDDLMIRAPKGGF